VKHDAKTTALRHIREADKRIDALTKRINARKARTGMTAQLERERAVYMALIELSRVHLHREDGRQPTVDSGHREKNNLRLLRFKGRV
jgi:hypothetical protein